MSQEAEGAATAVMPSLDEAYAEIAGGLAARLNLLLSAKRLVLSSIDLVHRPEQYGTAQRLRKEIEALQERREYWVLRSSPADPEVWITAYSKLLRACETAISRMPPGEDRRQMLALAEVYRARQRHWRSQILRAGPGDETQRPQPRRGPRLSVL